MNVFLSYLAALALVWVLASILYWRCVYPALRDMVLFRMFSRRDQLRNLLIDKRIDASCFAYEFLERRLSKTLYLSPNLTIFRLFRFWRTEDSRTCPPEIEKFLKSAPEALKEIWVGTTLDMVLLVLLNSPKTAMVALLCAYAKGLWDKATDVVGRFYEVEVVSPYAEVAA